MSEEKGHVPQRGDMLVWAIDNRDTQPRDVGPIVFFVEGNGETGMALCWHVCPSCGCNIYQWFGCYELFLGSRRQMN